MKKMKANAKKLLALIMAMVMVLSLAAPAFAAGGSDGGSLSVQVASATDVGEGNGNYTVKDGDTVLASGNVADATQPAGVTVTLKTAATDVIGAARTPAVYTVKYDKGGVATNTDVTYGTTGAKKSIEDVADAQWKSLDDSWRFFTVGTGSDAKKYQVSGSVYQEKQPNGAVKVYFKLATVDENDNFKTNETLYFVNDTERSEVKDAATMDTVLAGAYKCNSYGVKDTSKNIVAAKAAIEVKTVASESFRYSFVATNGSDVTPTVATNTDASDTISVAFATDKTSGTFQVSIQDKGSKDGKVKNTYVTSPDAAKTILEKQLAGDNAKIESVVAASGNFLTVTVSKIATADPLDKAADKFGKNVVVYDEKAGLLDLSKDGWYNATTKEGSGAKAITAGTELLGPVVVRVSDVPTANYTVASTVEYADTARNYYKFDSVNAMKKAISANDCKNAKAIPYVQVVLNPWNDTKQNGLVAEVKKAAGTTNLVTDAFAQDSVATVTLTSTWYEDAYTTPNAAFVKKGELEVEAGSHGTMVEVVEKTDATCKKAGTKTTKVVCTVCNKTISEKTEELPVVTDPVEKNTTDKVKDVDGEDVDKIVFDDTATAKPASKHFIKKAETTTTVSDDKTQTIKTTVYTCNLGEVHSELTRTETIKKVNLQHAGKWNFFKLNDRDGKVYGVDVVSNLFGYDGITIADSDVEIESLPLNRKAADIPSTNRDDVDANGNDIVIKFDQNALAGISKNDDGSYSVATVTNLKNVYTSATALPTSKTYIAKLTAKDINEAKFGCQTGSAVLVVDVYEVDTKKAAGDTAIARVSGANLEKNLAKGYATLKQSYTQNIVMRARYNHEYDEKTDTCTICGTPRVVVDERKFNADTITVSDLKWTGKAKLPKVVVKDTAGNLLIKGIDYEFGVEDDSATAVGEYIAVIKGIGDYSGNRISKTYKITKAAGKITASGKAIQAKKKKAVKGKVTIKVTGGKVKAVKGSGVKGVKITKKGVITVPKKCKGGTLKVKITMKADKNHTAAKAKTVKVTIKKAK